MTDAIVEHLRDLKAGALRATRERDVAYYDGYLADDAIAILPYGIFDKAAVLRQVAGPRPGFRATSTEDEQVSVHSSDCGTVRYVAVYPDRRAVVTTVFVRRDGVWRAVLYQQTVLGADTSGYTEPSRGNP
jgi:hypothetical protein